MVSYQITNFIIFVILYLFLFIAQIKIIDGYLNIMIRSTKVSLKFSNKNKFEKLFLFIEEYQRITKKFINLLWNMDKIPVLLPKEITDQISKDSWLSQRSIQCSGKQASAIVRGTKTKQNKRLWQINKFIEEKMFKKARKLKTIYETTKISKPSVFLINPELDSRFAKINIDNKTCF